MEPSDKKSASESDLMDWICTGDEVAFAILVERHTQRFFNYAAQTLQSRADAEDAVQASFVKLWRNPHRFDSRRAAFTTWFYRVVLNECRDTMRRRHTNEQRIQSYVQECIDTASDSSNEALSGRDVALADKQEQMQRKLAVELAMHELNARDQEIINLVIYSELPQAQAAEIMGISLKALESALARAKQRLIEKVQKIESARDSQIAMFESPQHQPLKVAK